MKPHVELEYKLTARGPAEMPALPALASSARELGIEFVELATVHQRDTYLDDEHGRLLSQGRGLRVRSVATGQLVEVKVEHRTAEPVFLRSEFAHAHTGPRPKRASDLPHPIRDQVEPFVLGRRLHRVVELRAQREKLLGSGVEISRDTVEVRDRKGRRVGSFAEIEVEALHEGAASTAESLAEHFRVHLGLDVVPSNKLRRALALAGVEFPEEPDTHTANLGLPAAEAGRRILARHATRLAAREVAVRSTGGAPDEVRRVRTACRRMRCALDVFGIDDERIDAAIRDTADQLAPVRELDVLIGSLRARLRHLPGFLDRAAHSLLDRLLVLAEEVRTSALDSLRAKPRLSGLRKLQDLVAAQDLSSSGEPSLGDIAPALVRDAVNRVLTAGRRAFPSDDAEVLHAFRLDLKRLRYLVEDIGPDYGRDLVRLRQRVEHLQEILGEVDDTHTVVAACRRLVRKKLGLKRREVAVVGAWVALESARCREAREQFRRAWSEFDNQDVHTWIAAVLRAPTASAAGTDAESRRRR
ncbi:MAG: CHAD domain-containing protein [Planctomycetota bacterium]|nr:CHAD domain-containing protein [Planctomycetota bacterium]